MMSLRSKVHSGAITLKQTYQFVKTLFFGNEINSTHQTSQISHEHYKINYNRCLGSGTFSCVYEVSPRPETEKGYLARFFPLAYDYFYPTSTINASSTQYCVKVYKTSFRISLEYALKPHKALFYPLMSFFNPYLDDRLNYILRKYGLTKMEFVNPRGFYSQFKTLVRGNTFGFYADNNDFIKQDNFEFRKAFVGFLRSVKNAPLIFYDIHAANIMYDTQNQRWEIIDGYVREAQHTDYTQNQFFKDLTRTADFSETTRIMLEYLNMRADSDTPYTLSEDQIQTNEIDTWHSSSPRAAG